MVVSDLPAWLVDGILLGVVLSGGVLGVYLLGMRWFDAGVSAHAAHDPDELRRAEIRAYLAAIGEPATERTTVDGVEVDFHLPERGVAITFDAFTFLTLRADGYRVVLVEHEVPGDQIGVRLPFETPTFDVTDPPETGGSWAHECLGVAPDADADAIEAAYRERVLDAHPDQGGSHEDLATVLRAYEHLSAGSAA